jgi:hypothetical protein
MRKILLTLFLFLLTVNVEAGTTFNTYTGKFDIIPTVTEEDASPAITTCKTYKFANSNLTDNGDGTCSIADQTGAGGATAWNSIGDAAADGSVAFGDTSQDITANTNDTTAITQDVLSIEINNDALTDALVQRIFVLEMVVSNNGVENALVIDNKDTDDVLVKGIEFVVAAGGLTTAIDASDPQIADALNIGANPIATGNNPATIGDSTTDSWTVTTDSTGNGEVVLPDGSVSGTEVLDDTIGDVDVTDAADFNTASFGITIDGGGSVITTGVKGYIEVPFAMTIDTATFLCDQSGSIVVDVWKDTYANYPPVDADSITAAAPPTISGATKSQDTTLTGWTLTVAAGVVMGFNVDSVTTVTRCHLIISGYKT